MLRWTMVIALAACAGAAAGCGGSSTAEAATEPLTQGYGFKVEIDGEPSPDPWIFVEGLGASIAYEDAYDPTTRQVTTKPLGSAPSVVKLGLGFDAARMPQIHDWVKSVYDGQDVRKKLTISMVDHAGQTVRTFNLVDCMPLHFTLVGPSSADRTSVVHWTLEVRVNRWEPA